jgi:translation elongation factor EF-Ts
MSLTTDLRAKTGASFVECRDALVACNNDINLAQGWLRFYNLAVVYKPREGETREEARSRAIMEQAREWVEKNIKPVKTDAE